MRYFIYILLLLLISHCSKPKTVLICGDHVCVNKTEAKQYFEENLSIEVKIIDKKDDNVVDLVELNLKENSNINKKISITNKTKTNQKLKVLTKKEVVKIKEKIKNKKNEKKFSEKKQNIKEESKTFTANKIKKEPNLSIIKNDQKRENNKIINSKINIRQENIVDVCTIIEKCSIDEISKFLLEQGNKKGFPDITKRQ
jgi:hypothetical protein